MHDELQAGFETGNLRLVRRIGAGGMGTVWLAEHTTLRTRVAVKFVTDTALTADSIALERFAREAELLARLKSPHIVQVLDRAMTNSGIPYLVLELLEGETLARHVARHGGASLSVTRRVVEHVGKALAKAHALGVVHRDVKPDNIYLARGEDGLVCKVFDFGIAKERGATPGGELTTSGAMVGTPSYMSPEQFADSSTVDEHVDRWGLAVVAYLCLTGTRPFTGSDLVELCRNVLRSHYEPPSRRAGEVDRLSQRVDAWFARAFAPQRAERFETTAGMVAEFLHALEGQGLEEPSAEELEPEVSPASRRMSPPRRSARSSRGSGPPSAARSRTQASVGSPLGKGSPGGAAPTRAVEAAAPSDDPLVLAPDEPSASEEPTRIAGAAPLASRGVEEPTRTVRAEHASLDASQPTVDLGKRQVSRLVAAAAVVAVLALGAVVRSGRAGSHAPAAEMTGSPATATAASLAEPRAPSQPGSATPAGARPDATTGVIPVDAAARRDAPPTVEPATSTSRGGAPPSAPRSGEERPGPSTAASQAPAAKEPSTKRPRGQARPVDTDVDFDHGF